MNERKILISKDDEDKLIVIISHICNNDRLSISRLYYVEDLTDNLFWKMVEKHKNNLQLQYSDGMSYFFSTPFSDGRGVALESKIQFSDNKSDYLIFSVEMIFERISRRFIVGTLSY
jgi:hypothetical protein